MKSELRIVFLGNHTVGVRTLNVVAKCARLEGVVAHPENSEDGVRYESVFSEAIRLGIPAIRATGKSAALRDFISALSPDLIWVTDFRYLLMREVIDLASMGAINIHPSLLPAYRGRASINWAILRGEFRLGVTAHFVDVGIDSGDIISQREYFLTSDEDVGDALRKLYPLYENLTEEVLDQFRSGKVQRRAQSSEGVGMFPARRPEDGLIYWNANASKVRNLVRAVAAPYPGAFTPFSGGLIRIWKVGEILPLPSDKRTRPGEVLAIDKSCRQLVVACRDAALALSKIENDNPCVWPAVGDVLGDENPTISVQHNKLMHGEEEVRAVSEVVRSGKWAGSHITESMESRFAKVAGANHAIAIGTGLGALRLALLSLGIERGDAVAVPGYSCVALANAVLSCGAQPIPVEIDPHTLNISPSALMKLVQAKHPRIRAAIAVHTFGCPADLAELSAIDVPLIEDCSHAFGRSVFGSHGRVAIMSLYATKLVGAGEGGVIFTSDPRISAEIRRARDYTDLPPYGGRLNDKPSSFTAAIALCQLDRLPGFLARRDHLASRYNEALSSVAAEGLCRLPVNISGRVWYRYALQLRGDVDEVISAMGAFGIVATRPVTPWCEPPGKYCADAFAQTVSLPMYPALSDQMQDRVVNAFLQAIV